MGKNASGQTHYLSLSGFEIYGHVTGVCDDLGKSLIYQKCFMQIGIGWIVTFVSKSEDNDIFNLEFR